MGKRITLLLLSIIISITLSSCSQSSHRVWKDLRNEYPDLMGKVEVVSADDKDNYYIQYDGYRYNVDNTHLFDIREDYNKVYEGDVLISWYVLPFGIGYLDKYYSYTTDNPIFIYISRYDEMYLRDDYDYETDVFIIEGTNNRFVFSDMFTLSSAFSYNNQSYYQYESNVIVYSEQCPRLRIPLRIFSMNDEWFAIGNDDCVLFQVSDELLSLLNIDR